jgi:hypothetical protein
MRAMAYLKPPLFTRKVFNPLAMRFGIAGTETLAVARRRTGGTLRVPVIPVEHDGARYLVSTRGEADWVRNLRAAGRAELGGTTVAATELPAPERAVVLEAYRRKAGKTVEGYFTKLPDPADHPVFRLDPQG